MIEDRESAWKDYVKLCSIGGTKSFLNLVKYANLKSPFEEGCVSSIIKEIERWLEKVDDINFIHKVKICKEIKRLLIENHRIFIDYGPRSEIAIKNPLSNAYEIWAERKSERIIPNNEKIVNIINDNKELFTIDEYEVCYEFIEHANGFKKGCDLILEDVKQFPNKFNEVINKYAKF